MQFSQRGFICFLSFPPLCLATTVKLNEKLKMLTTSLYSFEGSRGVSEGVATSSAVNKLLKYDREI